MINIRKYVILSILSILLLSCSDEKTDQGLLHGESEEHPESSDETQLFTLLDSTHTGIGFANTITEVEGLSIILYEYLYNGGGVATGDINNDGLVDVYFNGSMEFSKLYLNEGGFRFKDITDTAGVDGGIGFTTGVTMVDINADGLLDIYVCKSMANDQEYRRNVLYVNNGDLTFTERAAEYGIDDPGYSTQGYFFDMDGDGDLDLFVLNHPANTTEANNLNVQYNEKGELVVVKTEDLTDITDRLYENTGNRFIDITARAGVEDEAFGLSAVIGDFNNDFRPDIYVCNDYSKPDYLYINNGDNTFSERYSEYFRHGSFSSMGSDYADFNNDGHLDLLTLDMLPREHYRQNTLLMLQNFDSFEKMVSVGLKAQYVQNTLQLNNGNGTYSDICFLSNTAHTDWSWTGLFADFDNDGWKDLFITNGYKRDVTNQDYARYVADSLRKEFADKKLTMVEWLESIPSVKLTSYLFKNNGNLLFTDVSRTWNSGTPAFSNGAAYVDLDNDGYLDIVVNNIDEPAFVLKNEGKHSRANNYIRFMLLPTNGKTTYGTRVRIHSSNGRFQDQVFFPTRGYFSSVEPLVHFGIGKDTSVSSAEIIWPDGSVQKIDQPQVNIVHRVARNPMGKYRFPSPQNNYFEEISEKLPRQTAHQENYFIDFKREPLLLHKYSEEGPASAVGDVNGDGLDDIYVGGAAGYPGKLLLQQHNGNFTMAPADVFVQDSLYEDVAALFLDANGDDALDLIVASGGNERPIGAALYQNRLYLNDGSGRFSKSAEGLPGQSSDGCIAAADIDGDGDPDLFVGARVSPGKYPTPPVSHLLRNDNGRFTDVTSEWSEGLADAGMLTDAHFADIDNDGTQELILAGEWMPVSIFKNINNKFVDVSAQFDLADITGWWYALEIVDLNEDGYLDIVAGNIGLNSHVRASAEKPVTLHYKDFDNNGSIDPIMCFYNRERSYPFHFRDKLLDHMISLKKKFTRYHMYANATLEDIFTPEQLKDSKVLNANTFAHTLFINRSGAGFTAQELPQYTQISTVRSIQAMDVNKDGMMDVIMGGNFYGTDAQFGRYDASVGAVLIGNGQGDFTVVGPAESGFSIPGDVRGISLVKSVEGTYVLVTRNNDAASLFRFRE